ncbi:MAG TPA: hypothetical protein PK227_02985 [Thermomonas sp.]|jgi:hypothetical protein|uniref:hypothetical protein n=1 Tax=Thermomonas sp. TaxID=1971895 RepID=UPI002C236590|nr:hypothetical protein [Thermomonas sp.]HPM56091.1 hypothetical protein [Thermomonas sp.]HPW13637.1 hypothetical protein [Thermomonas sp.]
MSIFRNPLFTRFNRVRFASFGAPRRPRHPFLRLALGLVGVALLIALLFVSVFVGIAMLAAGMLFRLFRQRRAPMAARAGSIDADYRVVGKAQLPLAH